MTLCFNHLTNNQLLARDSERLSSMFLLVLVDIITINGYVITSAVVKSVEEAEALDFWFSKYMRKSITKGSVHGKPRGAPGPATHPRCPPLGVTINIQFGFSCNNSHRLKNMFTNHKNGALNT